MLALDQARGQFVDHLEARQPAQAAAATETSSTAMRTHAA
jgi:hypothetical protein